jgi:8-oxo-dGTP pyrophosphatase MutT (NUDIX family)
MAKTSAGILVFKRSEGQVKVLLSHHGGPFWAKKDNGAWSIIKGETDDNEAPFEAAKREFKEETSHEASKFGQLKRILIQKLLNATHSRWNGRQSPVKFRNFRKMTALNGLKSMKLA